MDMCPRHVGGRYPTPGLFGEGFPALSRLPLHANHLAQRVHHVHQIALRFHHGIDGLVRHRRFVDDIRVLTALDAPPLPWRDRPARSGASLLYATWHVRLHDCNS